MVEVSATKYGLQFASPTIPTDSRIGQFPTELIMLVSAIAEAEGRTEFIEPEKILLKDFITPEIEEFVARGIRE